MLIIALDPGHGGSDPGAVFHGTKEKDIVLEVTLYLKTLLLEAHQRVILTRAVDVFIPLERRAKIAINGQADVLLSIHCNADADDDAPGKPEAQGAEVWVYPGSASSKKLAEMIGQQFSERMSDEPWRGVKEGNFLVLRHTANASIPACLVEIGFIDNSSTMRLLKTRAVQKEIAVCLFQALMYYEAQISRL